MFNHFHHTVETVIRGSAIVLDYFNRNPKRALNADKARMDDARHVIEQVGKIHATLEGKERMLKEEIEKANKDIEDNSKDLVALRNSFKELYDAVYKCNAGFGAVKEGYNGLDDNVRFQKDNFMVLSRRLQETVDKTHALTQKINKDHRLLKKVEKGIES